MSEIKLRRMARRKKFLSYYKPYRGLLAADLACASLVSASALALPLCAGYITTDILEAHAPAALGRIAATGGLMLALVALHTACNIFVDYRGHLMGARMEGDMRAELFEHFHRLSFRFYDDQTTGQLMSRITHDTFWLAELYHHGPEDTIIALLKFVGALAILFSINFSLTLIIVLFLPLMAGYALYFNKRMDAALERSKQRIGDINQQVEDALAGIRVVQSFTNEDIEQARFTTRNNRFIDSRREGYQSEAYHSGGLIAFTQLFTIAVVVFGGMAILNASLNLGELVTYLLVVGILIEPIHKLVNFAWLYQEGITGFNRIMEILEVAPDIEDAPDAVELGPVRGSVAFRDISFQYRDDHQYVLRNISLDIQAGEYVALVGISGVGKTTLCSLIPRFYEASAGQILIDGQDIRRIRLRSLRQAVGVVQQDVYLFAGTVAENIGYGKPGSGRAAIVDAAKRAYAHEFIMTLPNGYDTFVGQRGVRLSGGQKQRLSIARALLKDPPILIFDEATSALDNESEKAIQASLETLARDRTMLVIAHRLSTVRSARRIIVLGESGIEEQGTHLDLLARGGVYASLYSLEPDL